MSQNQLLCPSCGGPTTPVVCGTFDEPVTPDEGRGYIYRQKISCEAPVLPVAPCADDYYETLYQPGMTGHPFTVLARLYDQLCVLVTDEHAQPIWLVIV